MSRLQNPFAATALIGLLAACGQAPSSAPQAAAPASGEASQAAAPAEAGDAGAGPAAAQAAAPAGSAAPTTASASGEEAEDAEEARIRQIVAALPAPYNQGDYERGRRVAAQCRSCHTLDAGGRNLVGPNLHGLFGRRAGSAAGFNYSQGVRDAGFTWNEARLDQWLTDPRGFIPGNRMAFAGVRREEERRDLITYLHVETGAAR